MSFYAIFSVLVILSFSLKGEAKTMAQALGFSPSDRVLLLHADDMGMTKPTNRAVKEVLDYGLVQSASIMIPAPAAKDAIDHYSQYDLGIHIALNSEWPKWRWTSVADPRDVSSITTHRHGYLMKGRLSIMLFGRGDDVYEEVHAQVLQALQWGLRPSHMDSHMGTVLFRPSFGKAYLKVAREFEIPPMLVRWSDHLKKQLPPVIMNHLRRSARLAEESGWLLFDHIYLGIDGNDYETRKKAFIQEFKALRPGVSMMFMHPSYFDDLSAYFPSDVVVERQGDLRIFTDPEIRQVLAQEGIKLITWKDIQQAYDWHEVSVPSI